MAKHAKVVFPGQIDPIGDPSTDPLTYPLKYLAEGDSWFSFGSWKFNSMLNTIRLARPTIIVTLAQPGDTITRMSDLARNIELKNWLSRSYGAYSWNAILMSGGGNDVIADVGKIVPPQQTPQDPGKPVEEYVDLVEMGNTFTRIRDGYARIVELRDDPANSPCPGVPMITHEYDLATPRDAPARFLIPLLGPWLYPAMLKAKIPPQRWNDVSDFLLMGLGATLQSLETQLPNFHVARTQRTLKRADPNTTGTSNDWANEIHPTGSGFGKVAAEMAVLLEALT
jgi:hypothetical protein